MRQLRILLALAGLLAAPALAAEWGGITGHVTDLQSGLPISNTGILLYRVTAAGNGPYQLMQVRTNDRGFFAKMPLEPGRYVVIARVPGRIQGCAVDDVIAGETTTVNVKVGYSTVTCSGPRVQPQVVNPNAGGDLYIR